MNRRDAIKATALFTGAALSGTAVAALMQGCGTPPPAAEWTPLFFTDAEVKAIVAVADTILPRTDTPGASDVGVHRYIDLLLQEAYAPEDQARFKAGLTAFLAAAEQAHGKPLHDLEAGAQLAHLQGVEAEAMAAAEALALTPLAEGEDPKDREQFFLHLKGLVVGGYFTSEQVATELLAYDPVPGVYSGCVSLEEASGGKAWSL